MRSFIKPSGLMNSTNDNDTLRSRMGLAESREKVRDVI
jgi:hypothetical protein